MRLEQFLGPQAGFSSRVESLNTRTHHHFDLLAYFFDSSFVGDGNTLEDVFGGCIGSAGGDGTRGGREVDVGEPA